MNYEECLANCLEMNTNNRSTFCECVNTKLIDFFNYYPWYCWVAVLVVISFVVGTLYIVNHYSKVKN